VLQAKICSQRWPRHDHEDISLQDETSTDVTVEISGIISACDL